MKLPQHYYPTYWNGCNPLHAVMDWCKVRKLVRDAKRGDDIPPVLVEGFGNGNLLTGTHRSAANDVMMMLGGEPLIPAIELGDLSDDVRAKIIEALEYDEYDLIDALLELA